MSESTAAPTVPDAAIAQLRAAGFWTRIVSIFMFISIGFMLLASIASFILSGMIRQSRSDPPIWLIGVALLPSMLLSIPAAIFLSSFASRAKAFAIGRNPDDLTRAMRSNKTFWMYIVILMMISFLLNLLGAIVALVIAVANK